MITNGINGVMYSFNFKLLTCHRTNKTNNNNKNWSDITRVLQCLALKKKKNKEKKHLSVSSPEVLTHTHTHTYWTQASTHTHTPFAGRQRTGQKVDIATVSPIISGVHY